jgi:hypothetical protein
MRYLTIFIISILTMPLATSQIFEVGVFAGGSNLISDVGATNYIAPNQGAFGAIAKWNRSPRHSWRFSAIYTSFKALDSKSDDPRRVERDYNYENSGVLELSAGMEFTFWDFNLHYGERISTPYLFTGVTMAHHDNYYFSNGEQFDEETSSWAWGIPIVLGFKASITPKLILGAEIGARYTFSDELDGSIPDNPDLIPNYGFGNLNNNDWYTFTGITLTYTFGRDDCYCKF